MTPAVDLTLEQRQSALTAVLESREFLRSPALAKLLRYLCEQTFQGKIHEIKEFTIATDVYGKDLHFGEKRDSLVRVEVSRLRRRLQRYYETEGASCRIRILIRSGTYGPEFERVDDEELIVGGPASIETPPEAAPSLETSPAADSRGEEWRSLPCISAADCPAASDSPSSGPWKRIAYWALGLSIAVAGWFALGSSKLPKPSTKPNSSASKQSLPATSLLPPRFTGTPQPVRILAGSTTERSVDRFGVEWSGDRYYIGGENTLRFGSQERNIPRAIVRRAPDQIPFRGFRYGNFSYKIPLAPAKYELRLYFSEAVFRQTDSGDGAENQRIFDVNLNGKPLLPFFDIAADAGGVDTADIRVFENISPADDGFLTLEFRPIREAAWLNAIELIPNPTGRALPIRIVARQANYTDQEGNLWGIDRYFAGGRQTSDGVTVAGAKDPELFAWQRYGHFSYHFPVPPGKYRLRMLFAETFFGPGNRGKGGVGSRVFNVYCGGAAILRRFDIFNEAGENHAIEKVIRGISPSPQGRIDIRFEPVVQYPLVQAIELLPEGAPGQTSSAR